jgi:hypothetical protein
MALGSNIGTPKIYLTVGFGRIRQKTLENKQKVDTNTPGAIKRVLQSGTESWALEYDFVSGVIKSIFYKEDIQYGNSFEVVIEDIVDTYQVSFSEDSRFWIDFMKKLPNIDLNKEVKITTYDFTDKQNKHRAGISVEQDGTKIKSYYEIQQEDKTWELLHGFPSGEGIDFKDKDETKMYFIKVKKFLRNEFISKFKDKVFGTIQLENFPDTDLELPPSEKNDLPF